jgi:hypothetical protein
MPDFAVTDYTQDVETWWAAHPLNSAAPGYVATITHPNLVVDVTLDYGGDLQRAIDALSSSGGTLMLDNVTYPAVTVQGKSNVHFVGKSKAGTVLRGVRIFGAAISSGYGLWDQGVMQKSTEALNAANNRPRNYHFTNLTFDGNGATLNIADQTVTNGALFCRGVRDVLVDNCIIQNYTDAIGWGPMACNGLTDGFYARNTTFDADVHNALYADGAKSYGMIGCTISTAVIYRMGLHFTNNDFTADYDQDHVYSNWDKRTADFGAYIGNTINRDAVHGNALISIQGGPCIVKGNTVAGAAGGAQYLLEVQANHHTAPYDSSDPTMIGKGYTAYGAVVTDNEVEGQLTYILHANGINCVPNGWIEGHVGKYTVTNNHVKILVTDTVLETATVDDPNTVSGNTTG